MACTVGIGLSGGVDSAWAAVSLLKEGYAVRSYTMLLQDGGEPTAQKAAAVAQKLGIPHRVLDLRNEFTEKILDYFVAEYAEGRTPSPCVRCNSLVKFGLLREAMRADGCERIATGHYARREDLGEGRVGLFRGAEPVKDQSYFLGLLTQEQLRDALFPVGTRQDKNAVKEEMAKLGLVPKEQSESQDLCFLPNGAFAEFVSVRRPELVRRGKILEEGTGKVLGEHEGAFAYTVGQRRGLGLGGGPWFVTRTSVPENLVFVSREAASCREVMLRGVNWLVEEPCVGEGLECEAQLRYRMRPRQCTAVNLGEGRVKLLFGEDAPAVPAGQLGCGYQGDRVILAGWIQGETR